MLGPLRAFRIGLAVEGRNRVPRRRKAYHDDRASFADLRGAPRIASNGAAPCGCGLIRQGPVLGGGGRPPLGLVVGLTDNKDQSGLGVDREIPNFERAALSLVC